MVLYQIFQLLCIPKELFLCTHPCYNLRVNDNLYGNSLCFRERDTAISIYIR